MSEEGYMPANAANKIASMQMQIMAANDRAYQLCRQVNAALAEIAELRRDKALWDWMESHGGTCALADKTYLGDGVNAWAAWPIAMGDKYSAARSPRMAVAKAREDWARQTAAMEGGER